MQVDRLLFAIGGAHRPTCIRQGEAMPTGLEGPRPGSCYRPWPMSWHGSMSGRNLAKVLRCIRWVRSYHPGKCTYPYLSPFLSLSVCLYTYIDIYVYTRPFGRGLCGLASSHTMFTLYTLCPLCTMYTPYTIHKAQTLKNFYTLCTM